jgi:hypothetical protein
LSLLSSTFVNDEVTTLSATGPAAVQAPPSSKQKSYLDDGFIFGLEDSGLERPKGKVSQVVVDGDSLLTTPLQRLVVWGTLLGHCGFIVHSLFQMNEINQGHVLLTSMESFALLLSSWLLADFGSGVLHWSVDNYGNGRTPIMGSIIAAFQGHHSARKYECARTHATSTGLYNPISLCPTF